MLTQLFLWQTLSLVAGEELGFIREMKLVGQTKLVREWRDHEGSYRPCQGIGVLPWECKRAAEGF